MAYYAALLTILLIAPTLGQNPCDFYQVLAIGQTYYIHNKEYPLLFPQGTQCRWISSAPIGYKIELNCNDISIAQSPNCASDRMAVSLTGDPNFTDGQNYCGTGTLYLVSTGTSMSVGLYAVTNLGGRMSCQIRAIVDTTSSTTTQAPSTCDCGWRQQRRIVGGTETGVNEYPFTAALINMNERRLFCGATIIHYHYGLTAAHCLVKIDNVAHIALLVGDHDYSIAEETNSAALYPLSGFKYHEGYSSVTQQNDIGIVRTQVDMTFSMSVGPACLPFKWTDATPSVGSTVTVLGWGTTEFTGPQSKVLLAANLSIVSNPYCQAEYAGRNQIFATQICTFTEGKDACQSDSGGPVVYYDNNTKRLHLAGTVSYGVGCAMDFPGVNTRTTSFMSWIITNTPDASYCVK